MALDFNNVSAINLPDGVITKIEIDGNVVWETARPIVNPTNDTMSFGEASQTTVAAGTGIVNFATTPEIDDDGVVDFKS